MKLPRATKKIFVPASVLFFVLSSVFLLNMVSIRAAAGATSLSAIQGANQLADIKAKERECQKAYTDAQMKAKSNQINVGQAEAAQQKYIDCKNQLESLRNEAKALTELKGQGEFDKFVEYLKKAGSNLLGTAARNLLNQMAYDAATWIGSGYHGQKPMWIQEGWGEYLENTADEAVGRMIEEIGKNNGVVKFNLCEPSLDVKMKITLGLIQYQRPTAPACTWKELTRNWQEFGEEMKLAINKGSEYFLPLIVNSIEPTNNDLGIALSLQTQMIEDKYNKVDIVEKERIAGNGWLSVRNLVGGKEVAPPGSAERETQFQYDLKSNSYLAYTGNAIEDASTIFLNQLAISAFQEMMRKLGEKTYDSPDGPASSYYAGPFNNGQNMVKDKLVSMKDPNFKTRGDYDVLTELVTCQDPSKPGPTNCVINNKFRDAITDRLTVGEAFKKGYLQNTLFGYEAKDKEADYASHYSYRSMIILRKFRILPVGWELAAQYINNNFDTVGQKMLGDMIACFDPDDEYDGYTEVWCQGLVDPRWVLKAPQNYCRREGPGPEIASMSISGSGNTSYLQIQRKDNYCADEQSCIKENPDGSCRFFGYCSEERRTWDFGAKSCEPQFNTCQSFQGEGGQTVSYLKNTIDYGVCGAENAGCSGYCTDYDFGSNKFTCSASDDTNKIYLDSSAETCDSDNEGCHKFIRTKSGNGTNLALDPGFESTPAGSEKTGSISTVGFWYLDPGVSYAVVAQAGSQHKKSASAAADTTSQVYSGNQSLFMNTGNGNGLRLLDDSADRQNVSFPRGFKFERGQSYTVTARIYILSGGAKMAIGDKDTSGSSGFAAYANSTTTGSWISLSVSAQSNDANRIQAVLITGTEADSQFYIDEVKVEENTSSSGYTDYGANNVAYQKLLPAYMEDDCYADPINKDYGLKANHPDFCDKFVRKCSEEEAGCQMYTSQSDGSKVPAKVSEADHCPKECVGFDQYLQSEGEYDSLRPAYLIPRTAKTCGAEAVGCEQYTNLDTLSQGGESTLYLSSLRRCIKPDETRCYQFYTWEGSEETGFQLKVFSLEGASQPSSESVTAVGPKAVDMKYNDSRCTQEVFQKNPMDGGYDPDCREFYDQLGNKFYQLYSKTISCSDSCFALRRTAKNTIVNLYNENPADQPACLALITNRYGAPAANAYSYDSATGECTYCLNGGAWDNDQKACVYTAMPSESRRCTAAQSGCREYIGNSGNNVRVALMRDFEDGTSQGFAALSGSISNSNEALLSGGESLQLTGATNPKASIALDNIIQPGNSYTLSFLAKAEEFADGNPPAISAYIQTAAGSANFIGNATLSNQGWETYEFNMPIATSTAVGSVALVISVSGATSDSDIFIDNVKLSEVTENYYFIKDSWRMPVVGGKDICNWDIVNNQAYSLYSLGCSAYSDVDGQAAYLHSFSKLCQDSAVGCEKMIDTQNSDYSGSKAYEAGSQDHLIATDTISYVVYDPEKKCAATEEGCQRLGKAARYENKEFYKENYLKNDPDKYDSVQASILCSASEADCKAWSYTGNGQTATAYFKDPGDQICEWRRKQNSATNEYAWFEKKVSRCADSAGVISDLAAICQDSSDCANGKQCQLDETEYYCPVNDKDSFKTIGIGGPGSIVYQPVEKDGVKWAGTCPVSQSSCTEYIEPLSQSAENMLYNSDFTQDVDSDSIPDNWSGSGSQFEQSATLKPSTLYSLTVYSDEIAAASGVKGFTIGSAAGSANLRSWNADSNTLNAAAASIAADNLSKKEAITQLFYYSGTSAVPVPAKFEGRDNTIRGKVSLHPVNVSYALKDNIDSSSCNGVVNYDNGCILFDDRSYGKNGYKGLEFDADSINTSQTPNNDLGGANRKDSNVLLKVKTDRTCNKWFACRSYIKDADGKDVCYDVGTCDAMDSSNNCTNFVLPATGKQYYSPFDANSTVRLSDLSNMSGYAKLAYGNSPFIYGQGREPNAYYPFSSMSQVGNSAEVSNGSFETVDLSGYPTGWYALNSSSTEKVWSAGDFVTIFDPVTSQNEGTNIAPDGSAFLKIGAGKKAKSETLELTGGSDYIIEATLNTSRMSSGKASVMIRRLNDSTVKTRLELDAGKGWTKLSQKFNAGSDVQYYLTLESGADISGNWYADNIKIKPVLKASQDGTEDYYIPRSCRLYPQTSSLSCDYYDDSGARERGWYGYCLEHDPANPDACLMWYPIDRINGDSREQPSSSAYNGRYPLYYCADAKTGISQNKVKFTWESGQSCEYEFRADGKYKVTCGSTIKFGDQAWRTSKDPEGNIDSTGFTDKQFRMKLGDPVPVFKDTKLTISDEPHLWDGWDKDHLFFIIVTLEKIQNNNGETEEFWRFSGVRTGCCPFTNQSHQSFKSILVPRYPSKQGTCYLKSDFSSSSHNNNIMGVMNYEKKDGENWINTTLVGKTKMACTNAGSEMCDACLSNNIECTDIVQTVSSDGQSKPFANRLVEGSDFQMNACNGAMNTGGNADACAYDSYSSPYGAMDTLAPENDPSLWDFDPMADGLQPVTYERGGQTGMGQQVSVLGGLQRLFARSYGHWQWDATGYCQDTTSKACDLNASQCPEGQCNLQYELIASTTGGSVTTLRNQFIDYPGDSSGFTINGGYASVGKKNLSQLNNTNASASLTEYCAVGESTGRDCYDKYNANNAATDEDYPVGERCVPVCCIVEQKTEGESIPGATDYQGDKYLALEVDCAKEYKGKLASSPVPSVRMISGDQDADGYLGSRISGGTCSSESSKSGQFCNKPQSCPGDTCMSYGDARSNGYYKKINGASSYSWSEPTGTCGPAGRTASNERCAIPPRVANIKVNGNNGSDPASYVHIKKGGFVKLDFNSIVDAEQMPVTMYSVNWGISGETTSVSDVQINARPNANDPHSLYYLYSYWELLLRSGGDTAIRCGDEGEDLGAGARCGDNSPCCAVQPNVIVKDNWGWCSRDTNGNRGACNNPDEYAGWVIVDEK